MKILPVIKQRRSIRAYQSKPVSKDKIKAILQAAMYAPSARHTRAWKFMVVTKPELIQQLGEMKAGGEFVQQAQAVIVVLSEEFDHWLEDASIAAAHIYLEATHQGLGTCWTHVHGNQASNGKSCEEYVQELLGISADKKILCLMPLGYPAEEKAPHSAEEYEEDKVQWIE